MKGYDTLSAIRSHGGPARERAGRSRASLLCCILIGLLMAVSFSRAETASQSMWLHQVNVGCANCHLLISGDTVIMIDGGTNAYKPSTAPANKVATGNSPEPMMAYVAASGIDHIDAHFLTHYHNDHAQQMPDFSRLYGRDSSVVYGPSEALPDNLLPLPNGTYQQLKVGEELKVGPFHILCVGPAHVRREGQINEDSLNLLVTFGSIRMVFTGDYMSDDVWEHYDQALRNVDVFVFPHHGLEPYAVTAGSLQKLNPRVILLPGDPEGRLRTRCLELRLRPEIYGNRHGNIVLTSDGEEIQIHEQVTAGDFAGIRENAD